jgi:predicted HicB family RNase H-like nuclease
MAIDHYTYRVSWSPNDEEYVATCVEFPSLSWLSEDDVEALRGIKRLVQDVIADMTANAEALPTPIADQQFSGKFLVRVPPELHRRLALEAAEAKVSLNRLASLKLAGEKQKGPPSERPSFVQRPRLRPCRGNACISCPTRTGTARCATGAGWARGFGSPPPGGPRRWPWRSRPLPSRRRRMPDGSP